MTTMQNLPPQDVLDRIQKLLNMAAKGTEHEAATAASMAQSLLAQYNLYVATVERSTGLIDGKREELKVQGGFYKFQRELWEAVAQLNYCLYWTQEYTATRDKRIVRRGVVYDKGRLVVRKRHALVGRVVNVKATVGLAQYLEAAIDRAARKRLGGDEGKLEFTQLWSNWGVSFRSGAADLLIEKVHERRAHLIKEEKRRISEAMRKAREAGREGVSTATALTLGDLVQREEDANMDFLYGEGWSAERRAEQARWAEEQRQREAEHTAWAKANPEEARKLEEERRKVRRGRTSYGRSERDNKDYGAYYAGRDAAGDIGLDEQVGKTRPTGLIGRR